MNTKTEQEKQEQTTPVIFNVDDVLCVYPKFTRDQAKAFLDQNHKYIEEAMSKAGFEAIENLWLEEEEKANG